MGVKRKRGGVHLFVVLNDDVVIDALTLWNENKLFSYVPPPPPHRWDVESFGGEREGVCDSGAVST